ncbi:efflux RND transporter periplasmic adaptor subunit [Glaciimonas sp. Gout2]|uniref:efflux RND transporter periplasmic adaptor subunit n=1 Tax=unclassified Glaciimonas TaxID=2644401 RepID=UPI002B226E6E|nr:MULTISPECIES: efflux RND transporter periplasmic adaptor subunit [unclassified Glaciimonas]MEB0013794.1 efflux RND transporter periplasmic adaptor subunit [Glaciimonas sp. Cout2]MEB0083103.1 efflux RND transporter periplasmic adaptor subunit [Glaciimonas sp. Gout2]
MNSVNSLYRFTRIALAIAVLSAVAACGKKPDAPGAPPPAEVSIISIAPERLALSSELPGRLEATRIAEVRARAAGIILKRNFVEGSDVKAGQILFRIDPAQLQATFESTQAALAKADANLTQATLKAQRYKPLVEANAVSKQDYDDAVALQKQAAADVASAKAARQTASLNLGYATVNSPISGRIGRALVTEGALVGQGEVTQLATVQQIDPIYVNLTQSSTDILKLQQALKNGQLQSVGKGQAKVTLVTEDGSTYPQSGKLLFSDLTVDPTTGSVSIRAEFPNPDHSLLPGMYVRAKLEQAVNDQAITVPQQAVTRDMTGATVFVVDADNKVVARTIKADNAQGDKWVVTEGLKTGDRVIVEGLQKIKPGVVVKPVPWKNPAVADTATTTTMPTPAAAPAAAASAAAASATSTAK